MKKMLVSVGTFFRVFKACLSEAWQDTECHHHIPKSRFRDNPEEENASDPSIPSLKIPAKNAFLGSFRDCVAKAWADSDEQYHIPKNRFQDLEFNEAEYSASQVPGVLSRIGDSIKTLKSCISTAWKESDHYDHFPKSRYQDRGFVREMMGTALKPQGQFIIRPPVVGLGVVGESPEDGWTVRPSGSQPEEEFIVPDDVAGFSRKPEIEPE